MRRCHVSKPGSAPAAVTLACAALSACRGDAPEILRAVAVHSPSGCTAGGQALDAGAYATYTALGDFDLSGPAAMGHLLSRVGEDLPEIPNGARELLVNATENEGFWFGDGPVDPSGDVDVLLLPFRTPCAATAASGARTGAAVVVVNGAAGSLQANRMVLVAGGRAQSGDGSLPASSVLRLASGAVAPVSPDLLVPRADASATAFGSGALVAGGTDPRPGGAALGTAEIYSTEAGGFLQQRPILLSQPRALHGAAVLATGETLLVGGVGGDGHTVLDSMEVVDPASGTVRVQGVARLAVARRSPEVLRLASGEILVAGGYDDASEAVPTVEWFLPDARAASRRAQDLVAGSARAFAPLAAGGALAVVAPPSDAGSGFQSVWVIASDGSFEPAAPVTGFLGAPMLFDGPGGAPALFTGDRWLRWQPWAGAFGALAVLDDLPARIGANAATIESGLAMWLDGVTSALTVLRFDEQNAYSPLPVLLATDASGTAPDRLPAPGDAAFDPAVGLTLGPSASVFVLVRTYAHAMVRVDVPTGQPPLVVFRDGKGNEGVVGGAACPFAPGPVAPSTLQVERTGASAAWSLGVGATSTCPLPLAADARVAVGLRGDPDRVKSVARNLTVTR